MYSEHFEWQFHYTHKCPNWQSDLGALRLLSRSHQPSGEMWLMLAECIKENCFFLHVLRLLVIIQFVLFV